MANLMQDMASGSSAVLQLQQNVGAAPYASDVGSTAAQSDIAVNKLQKLTADTKIADLTSEPEYQRQMAQTLQGIFADPANKGKSPSELTAMAGQKLISSGVYKSAQLGLALEEKASAMSQKEATARKEQLAEASIKLDSVKEQIASADTPEAAMSIIAESSKDPSVALRMAPIAKKLLSGAPMAEVKKDLMDIHATFAERVAAETLKVKIADEKRKEEADAEKQREFNRAEARRQQGLIDLEKERSKRDALMERRLTLQEEKLNQPRVSTQEVARTQRGLTGANIVAGALDTITKLPAGSTTGLVADLVSKEGMTNAVKSAAVRTISTDEAKAMSTIFAGIGRGLAAVETGGLATGLADLSKQMQEALYIKPGDSAYSTAMKLADTRRIMDDAIGIQIDAGTMPPKQAEAAQKVLDRVHKIIPYTTDDVADAIKAKSKKSGTVGSSTESKIRGTGTKDDPIKLD